MHTKWLKQVRSLSLLGVVLLVVMAQCSNDFKAFVFSELADIRQEMAASARATKMRRTDLDTESTNSGASSALSNRSGASEDEPFATPLSEQPPEIRTLLERAVALAVDRTWSRGTCQYFAMLRQHYEPEVQPARVESLSFCQLQELSGQLQLPPPQNFKGFIDTLCSVTSNWIVLPRHWMASFVR